MALATDPKMQSMLVNLDQGEISREVFVNEDIYHQESSRRSR